MRSDRSWLDRVGITASVACAIHCLAAPFLFLLLPAAGSVWSHPAVHWVLAALVLPLAVWVIYRGYLKHRKRWTLVTAGLGSACIIAGLIAPMVYDKPLFHLSLPGFSSTLPGMVLADAQGPVPIASAGHGGSAETVGCTDTACCPSISEDAQTGGYALAMPPGGVITLVGSVFLVIAHLSNLVACRCYRRDEMANACGESECGCPSQSG